MRGSAKEACSKPTAAAAARSESIRFKASRLFLFLSFAIPLFHAASSANPASSLHMALRELCNGVTGTIPSVSMLMVLAGSAIYASGQVMGSETRARSNVWATAALTGAVTGLMISTVTPTALQTIWGEDVNCMASGGHGSYRFCGTAAGELCCTTGNPCDFGLICEGTTCTANCGKADGGPCCPVGDWCGNAPNLYCTGTGPGATCSNACGNPNQHCCDSPSCRASSLNCNPSKVCQGCGHDTDPCCASGAQCNQTDIPPIACNTTANTCAQCGTGMGSLCCTPPNTACTAPNTACDTGTVPDTCAHCGAPGEVCCTSDPQCSLPWYSCQAGKCAPCGQRDQPCCRNLAGILPIPNDCNNTSAYLPLECQTSTCIYKEPICGGIGDLCCLPPHLYQCPNTANTGPNPLAYCNATSSYCEPCGTHGDLCCPSPAARCPAQGTQNLSCNTTIAPNPTCYNCGKISQPCCGGTSCNAGMMCDATSKLCLACGAANDPCCWNAATSAFDICTASGTFCNSTQKCQPCGTAGAACCQPGSFCPKAGSQNLSCNMTITPPATAPPMLCYICGKISQPCCGGLGGDCESPNFCSAGTCASCGLNAGDHCCAGNLCTQGASQNLTCNYTAPATPPFKCINCGKAGQSCCPTNICIGATTCASNLCYANCTLGAPITQPACACQGMLKSAGSGYCSMSNKFYASLPTCSPLAPIANNDPLITEQPCVCIAPAATQPPVPTPAANGKYCCNGVIQSTACTPTCTPGALIGSVSCICENQVRAANTGYCSFTNKYYPTLPICNGPITNNNPASVEQPCTCGTPSAIYTGGTCCLNTYTSTATTCCADGAPGICKCGTNPTLCTISQRCTLPNTCTALCTVNADCGAGKYCASDQTCKPQITPAGTVCSYSNTNTKTAAEVHGQCASSYCRDDYDGSSNGNGACENGEECWCASSSTVCYHNAAATTSGQSASVCFSTRYLRVCSSGAWVQGTDCYASDTCTDSGGSSGGGHCIASRSACSSGVCAVAGIYSSIDMCSGTVDSPVLTYYSCTDSNGNGVTDTCTAGTTSGTDTCTMPSTSCSATNYACSGSPGVFSSTATSGTNSCSGAGTPYTCSRTSYSCTASDGTVADRCLSSSSNIPSGYVCSSGAQVAGSGTYYSYQGTLSCSGNNVVANRQACDGSGGAMGPVVSTSVVQTCSGSTPYCQNGVCVAVPRCTGSGQTNCICGAYGSTVCSGGNYCDYGSANCFPLCGCPSGTSCGYGWAPGRTQVNNCFCSVPGSVTWSTFCGP